MTDERQPSESALRVELRRVLAEHEPDRTAMLNRIAANRGSRRTRWAQTARLAGSTLAVATVLGLGGAASWALAGINSADNMPSGPPLATEPVTIGSASPSPSASPTSRPATSRPRTTVPSSPPPSASASASTPEVRGHPGDTQVEKASLWSDGSVVPGGSGAAEQSAVTLKAGADVTELDLTIRVAMTPGLADQGATDNVATAGITATVERQSDALLYHFVLAEGATLPAGTYVFTARYGHDGATRDAGADTYEAFGTDVNRKRLHVYGNFGATSG